MNTINLQEPLLNRKEAAKLLNVSPGTLAVWDCVKRYDLKPLKIGRAVRYRLSDINRFLEAQQKP
jgi:predicted DNA-binding transcriptional regulator AlpA